MRSATALIIGGGVIGLSTAYHLARKGFGRILLVEKDHIGAGSSSRAGGIITSLLWTEAGVLARKISLDLYRELSAELPGYRFQDVGCLNLFDPRSWLERTTLLPLYDRLAVPYEVLTAEELRYRWPALTPDDAIIGLHDPLGGYSEPSEYIPALAQRIAALGVELREGVTVTGLVEQQGRISGITTQDGVVEADMVVCTTHAWTRNVLAGLGISLPVKAFVHQRYVTTPLPAAVVLPAINANPQGGYIRPAAGNRLLAGGETADREEYRVATLDFQMTSLTAPDRVKADLAANLTPLVPALGQTSWETEQVGLICFSVDGEPILGPVAGHPGLLLGCAFHSGGFAYNPVAGLLLAELITTGQTSIDISAFSPNRFTADVTADYLATTVTQAHAVRRRH
ncbi:MAG TPA: FAD-binding oxidoreductase [Caldilineaceae bacterium]|nr:FAD-binding oxidoreductase [Caldilineaceae bacterium]